MKYPAVVGQRGFWFPGMWSMSGSQFGISQGLMQPVANGVDDPVGLNASAVALAATVTPLAPPPSIRVSAAAKNVGMTRCTFTCTIGSWASLVGDGGNVMSASAILANWPKTLFCEPTPSTCRLTTIEAEPLVQLAVVVQPEVTNTLAPAKAAASAARWASVRAT